MDLSEALKIIEAVRAELPEADRTALDAEYASHFMGVAPNAGNIALKGAQPEATIPTPETTFTPEAPTINSESLLATLDTALTTYSDMVDTVSAARRGGAWTRKKNPEQLEAADLSAIRAEVEALVSDTAILADLQKEADYFTANPETDSPAVGFDIDITPEGLTTTDEHAIAKNTLAKFHKRYDPFFRDDQSNDKRSPEVTGKGYRIAFAPRHYNVPSGTAIKQTSWKNVANASTSSTELVTATDAEALAQINNLHAAGELNDPITSHAKSFYRRFDQDPVDDVYVSKVSIEDSELLDLGMSVVNSEVPARALVVPKSSTLNARALVEPKSSTIEAAA